MNDQILSITQINEYIRAMMDGDVLLPAVAVRGEISNYKCYPSGHHYFTLKDENSALRCVMFKGNAVRLRFRPENGMKIIACGKISVFPRDGAYQLYCTLITQDGVGDLHMSYAQLKAKLSSTGLFDPEHKKPIPKHPNVIGIITSSAGAAIHDMLRILKKRWPLVRVRLFPVRVQGEEAPAEIVAAIEYANKYNLADVLIVGRGGGSIEDLWAFNDEGVALAIYHSTIPVISAVGHEPDVAISDYVADLRAATPSNAAELAVPDQESVRQVLDQYNSMMASILAKQIHAAQRHLETLRRSSVLKSPAQYFGQRKLFLDNLSDKLAALAKQKVQSNHQRLVSLAAKLDAMSPLKVLGRGYSLVSTEDGTVFSSVENIKENDTIIVQVKDGRFTASVREVMHNGAFKPEFII